MIFMPTFRVCAAQGEYDVVVKRGAIGQTAHFIPPNAGRVFVISEENVWRHRGEALAAALADVPFEPLFLPGGEENKRLAPVERLAERMIESGGDRSSIVIAFGGGIVNDMGGFTAAIFMRGIPVVQIPTTLLAQVDAAIGGKTGVNLECGKNLVGSFHPPRAVLIDPGLLDSLPEREYRAGLYEILKAGIIADPDLFRFLRERRDAILARDPGAVERIIEDSVRMKVEVVSSDEREGDRRRILNFGHTFGHALEAETAYARFLHGEAVAWGMRAAVHLGSMTGHVQPVEAAEMQELVAAYGPIPPVNGIDADSLFRRMAHDKKTVQGKIHFVLPVKIGEVTVVSGIAPELVRDAIRMALDE